MNANQIVARLAIVDVDGAYEADARRVVRNERLTLTAAIQTGDRAAVARASAEAVRVARMWGVAI